MPTEKEKMLSGAAYDASDPELRNLFHKAKDLIAKYNASFTTDAALRDKILKSLLGFAGKGAYIEPPFYCDYGENIFFGDNVYLNCNCVFLDCAKITIGSRVLFAPNVHIYTAYHPLNAKERVVKGKIVDLASPVTIGDDVWIGGNVTILPGVTIGSNVVIGAGSVVTKSIPSNTVAFGNPCKIIKRLELL
ncbi:MAG: sugar O-acetyltransferase [Endomicrobia bacterium]|nr:sugar O-acetyltransferase [Endomicrobiia bacterium]MCL2506262.1 sugar O-acetyltransferase [Endomicrobiia bacterium]